MAIQVAIPFGDFIFRGVWTDNKPISICGERKHIPDILKCINDNRHLEQIRGAREAGFHHVFLVIEDQFRETPDGDVELRRRRWERQGFDYGRLESYLLQLEHYAGVRVFFARSARETAHKVINIYRMFQKPPEEHTSLSGFYEQAVPVSLNGRPSLKRRIFNELYKVGWEISGRAEEHFKGWSILEALGAGKEAWEQIERVGPEIARMVGLPFLSSFLPGASPTNANSAHIGPSAGTGPSHSCLIGQATQARLES